jgi:hypothetical protein
VLPAALVDGREAPLFELHAAIANVAAIGNARFMKWFTKDLSVLAHIYWEGTRFFSPRRKEPYRRGGGEPACSGPSAAG